MMAQRKGEELERRKARGAEQQKAKPAGSAGGSKSAAKKLSYKQKFALETLPKKIDELADEIAALEEKLADPNLYTRDAAAFQRFSKELDTARASREKMEEEWLELEMLREEVEGA
jgi:ATP-binding cassette subfamily F protein uup